MVIKYDVRFGQICLIEYTGTYKFQVLK
ncbi:unnamed protein product [Spirodela intermedia]|uniref:Uncharacterized protein n=1 Tax=Spirodela intermedia TaxID=51605 RepID=A0A7I8JSI9_SPIIN|nr:unnamed protein product [Spirodela intermedia]CAA6673150.1 unnamed protein product [Spirodela intermedia]